MKMIALITPYAIFTVTLCFSHNILKSRSLEHNLEGKG